MQDGIFIIVYGNFLHPQIGVFHNLLSYLLGKNKLQSLWFLFLTVKVSMIILLVHMDYVCFLGKAFAIKS